MSVHALKPGAALLCALICLAGAASAAEGWMTDFEAAKKKAATENKDLLIDFTGSDWCGWCIRLHEEVFSKDHFKAEAPKSFVLVELDFPRTKEIDPALKEQNDKLAKEYGIQGFPTILLLDKDGKSFGRTGYQAGGPEKYIEHLNGFRTVRVQRDEHLGAAAKTAGIEKAKHLDAALTLLEKNNALEGFEQHIKEVVELDADGKAGLKAKWETTGKLMEIEAAMKNQEEPGAIMKRIDTFLADAKPAGEVKQKAMIMKFTVCRAQGDEKGMIESLKEAHAAAPESEMGQRLKQVLDDIAKQQQQQGATE